MGLRTPGGSPAEPPVVGVTLRRYPVTWHMGGRLAVDGIGHIEALPRASARTLEVWID